MTERGRLRLGTRGSALAVRQAEWVAAELRRRAPGLVVDLVRIQTSGDRIHDRTLAEVGGKGLFVKEIEQALLAGDVDAGVHSMKDLPALLAPGLVIAAVPTREDPRDVLIARVRGGLAELPRGIRVGTGSLRRGAFLRHRCPAVEVVALRGNVDTRLRKWRAGEVDALVLARAGLRRLGVEVAEAQDLSVDDMLPAIGQGALAIEALPSGPWCALLSALSDPDAAVATAAERGFLCGIGGDCTTPVGALAIADGATVRLTAAIASPDGRRVVRGNREGVRESAAELGGGLAADLLARGGQAILRELRR